MGVAPRVAGAVVTTGVGPGWQRLAAELAAVVPPQEIQGVWVFAAVRREEREWGTAVVARRGDGERVRVYTASYALMVRGREKGQCRVEIHDVAECPRSVIYEVLKGVQERMAETEPPVEIPVTTWYPDP